MNLPDKVFDRIFNANGNNAAYILEQLKWAEGTYNKIIKQRNMLAKLKSEYDEQVKLNDKIISDYQNKCYHIWEEHRSGVDSADNFSQCLICGKYSS